MDIGLERQCFQAGDYYGLYPTWQSRNQKRISGGVTNFIGYIQLQARYRQGAVQYDILQARSMTTVASQIEPKSSVTSSKAHPDGGNEN